MPHIQGIEITKGEDAVFTIKLRNEFNDPFNLTNYDKFQVCLPKTDGSFLNITDVANINGSVVEIIGDPLLGKLQVTVDEVDTATLRVDERVDVDIELDNLAMPSPRRKRLKNVLTVVSSVC